MIRSLLKQLLFNLRTVIDGVETHYEVCLRKGKSADITTLIQQLILALAKFDRVFLLFDAFDEISSEYSKEVMSLISDLGTIPYKYTTVLAVGTAHKAYATVGVWHRYRDRIPAIGEGQTWHMNLVRGNFPAGPTVLMS